MRTVAVIAWLVVLTGSAGAIEVEVVASAPHGLFYLLECLREEPHHSQQLREVFRGRHPLSSEEESALADYRALMEGRWANLTFPATEIQERSLAHVLEVLAVRADSVPHFLEDARALLGPADSAVLTRACKLLEPSYRQLVWESSRPDLERQIGELKAQFEHGGANDRLQQAARFYESRWPADQGFLVVLTPVPREPGQKIVTHGHSNGHLQVVEAASGATQREAASVVFHELCHALYGTRAPEAEQELVGWFAGDSYPYQQLNEALATAVGNAWFHRLLTGDVPSKPWYHDTYVDGYAREVYPLVEEYLHEGRSLDEVFAARAAAAFAARFPQAGHDPALVLRRVLLLALDEDDVSGAARGGLAPLGRIHSLSAAAPLSSEKAVAQFQDLEGSAAIFLLPPDRLETLESYPFTPAEREALKEFHHPFVWLKRTDRGRWIVVSVASETRTRLEGIHRLFGSPTMSRGLLGDDRS